MKRFIKRRYSDMEKSRQPILLDLFCGAGGAAMGYSRAGFRIVGVDIKPQPRYPFEFVQADALEYVKEHGHEFDAIHASPPCQFNLEGLNAANKAQGRVINHADLIPDTRKALKGTGLPYVIENIYGANLIHPIKLCGSAFGLQVRRHRLFENNIALMALPCAHHIWTEAQYPTNCRNGKSKRSKVVQVYGNTSGSHLWADAMGIDWMNYKEIQQAIPPAYTEFIGRQLLAAIEAQRAA